MIILTSPTKQMDFNTLQTEYFKALPIRPHFSQEAGMINRLLEDYSIEKLSDLMKVSPRIAAEAYENIHLFASAGVTLRPAILSYSGTLFKALDSKSLNREALDYAGKHLRIISGLYGLLRPADLISPHRLDMNTGLMIPAEGRLSIFWKSRIAAVLRNSEALIEPDEVVLNLASGEYSIAIDRQILGRRMITFHFKERTAAGLRTVGMYSKTARGLMLRRILMEQPERPQSLQKGSTGGYSYDSGLSRDDKWVYIREAR